MKVRIEADAVVLEVPAGADFPAARDAAYILSGRAHVFIPRSEGELLSIRLEPFDAALSAETLAAALKQELADELLRRSREDAEAAHLRLLQSAFSR